MARRQVLNQRDEMQKAITKLERTIHLLCMGVGWSAICVKDRTKLEGELMGILDDVDQRVSQILIGVKDAKRNVKRVLETILPSE